MKAKLVYAISTVALLPSLAVAGEDSKGTLIMMSSVGGWVFVTSGLILFKEAKRIKRERRKHYDHSQE